MTDKPMVKIIPQREECDGEDDKEQLCRQCGACCHFKISFGDKVFTTQIPCNNLDTKTNLCKVYDNRFNQKVPCLTAQQALEDGALPSDCPYTKDKKDYKGPTDARHGGVVYQQMEDEMKRKNMTVKDMANVLEAHSRDLFNNWHVKESSVKKKIHPHTLFCIEERYKKRTK